ncbi:MAG: rod shape-determining protein MreC [Candidatus Sumerlaeia bacterium]|nr:rod shape-determining protein MreC [Candidatus Sumerlaeia bacterium]
MNLGQLWSERKKIIMIALLVALLVVVLARQADLIPPGPAGRVVRTAIQPLTAAVAAVDGVVANVWTVLFHSKNLVVENEQLRHEVAVLRTRNQQLSDALAQLQRLSKLTARLAAISPASTRLNVTANVVGFSPNFWVRSVTLDCGIRDGVTTGMPVVNQEGLVGFVRDVSWGGALVQLLVDSDFAAGAKIRETRDRGIVRGTGEMDRLLLFLDNPQSQVQPGYEVITSGLPAGALFRQGLVIGTIQGVEQTKMGQPCAIVKPMVRFDRLEEVVVLLEPKPKEPLAQPLPIPPP